MQNDNTYSMKEMVEIIMDDVKEIKDDMKTQNGRIRKLENWRWYLVGIFSGSMALVGTWLKYG